MTRPALLVATAALFGACSSPAPPPPNPGALPVLAPGGAPTQPTAPPRSLDGSAWTLAWVPGFELPAQPLATLRFEAGRAVGSDGCNRYATDYSAAPGQLRFGAKRVGTLMACPPMAEAVATRFGAVLYDTAAYRIEWDTLTLLDGAGVPVARLQEQANRIAGSAWQVTGVNNGRQAVVSVLAGTTLTMAFGADGRLTGSAGCNTFTATYTADGRGIRIAPPAATRKACALPEGTMAQEAAFLAALPTATSQTLEGDWLELRTADGALAVSARRAAP
jgi:heat shock protein HslJ